MPASQPCLSIILPCLNEAHHIGSVVEFLLRSAGGRSLEVIVADGGSTDGTVEIACRAGARIVLCDRKGRAVQMNQGANCARGGIFYFLHADTLPPRSYVDDILEAVQAGFDSGCYRLKFDHDQWFLRSNSWFTRFDVDLFRFGDQSLFVTRQAFGALNGFDESLILMEDQEFVTRLKRHGRFCLMKKSVVTSARKYLANGIYRLQAIFFLIVVLYKLGCSQRKLLGVYRSLIRQDRL